jgi:diadenosine tetraphosphate (Ap4A) HIT family hydrolase
MEPESAEAFYARAAAATDESGRLPGTADGMRAWDIYPYESVRLRPLDPLADGEASRHGEDPAACWCADPDGRPLDVVWRNDRWVLKAADLTSGLPVAFVLIPLTPHADLPTLPMDVAAEMGQLMVAVSAAIESLPSVGRAHVARYGDGATHFHLFFFGRPARMLQFRGIPLHEWSASLPVVPEGVLQANARFVADRLVETIGGQAGKGTSS